MLHWPVPRICSAPETRHQFDLTADIASANALVDRVAACKVNGQVRQLTDAEAPVTALLRVDAPDARNASRAVLVLANPDIGRAAPLGLSVSPLPPQAGAAFAIKETPEGADAPLDPGEVRIHFYPSPAELVSASAGLRQRPGRAATCGHADCHRGRRAARA